MTLFINGRFRQQPMTGVQRYATQIVLALDALAARGEVELDCQLVLPPDAPLLPLRAITQVHHGRLRGHAWEQVDFARIARGGVALSLAASGPVFQHRQVAVIHDAAIYRFPENYSRSYVLLHRVVDRLLTRRATIATVSDFSRGELAHWLGVPANEIVVAPNSAEHLDAAPDDGVFATLGLADDRPFFLTIGSLTRNKNLRLAIEAMRDQTAAARLVIVGQIDGGVFAAEMPDAPEQVILAGRLSDRAVTALMRRARALVFPSLYEGFGIPPLEAFGNDCPVLASAIPPVREVCGDAADYFDPHDAPALAALMRRALDDDGTWRADRLARGRARLGHFSWERSAATLAAACVAAARQT
ncbi:glycosyltransferase family 1 protein [Sphingomonas sp. BK580]|uniref:glycosyltransferase family 4 protein n=1 Tax=Sphingomonas sp. BK580 TaxID=2586972 RepID=UPI0016137D66|nr:glycosyltransferase family 1 protein [Sphingomonas sp. BK580]MBB3694668.1 glycosyltransferase involved in cell wall biosynthesis [Sphingomonas sp. BK580]